MKSGVMNRDRIYWRPNKEGNHVPSYGLPHGVRVFITEAVDEYLVFFEITPSEIIKHFKGSVPLYSEAPSELGINQEHGRVVITHKRNTFNGARIIARYYVGLFVE